MLSIRPSYRSALPYLELLGLYHFSEKISISNTWLIAYLPVIEVYHILFKIALT